jgi:hypothetical protein
LALFGCHQGLGTEIADTADATQRELDSIEYSRRGELTRFKAQGNNKTSMENLQQAVLSMFNQTVEDKSRVTDIWLSREKRVGLSIENRFTRVERSNHDRDGRGRFVMEEAEDETEPIEIYEFVIADANNTGERYVMASNDLRIGQILAITEASLEDSDTDFAKFYKECLLDYIEETIFEYNAITIDEFEAALEETGTGLPEGPRSVGMPTVPNPSQWELYKSESNLAVKIWPMIYTKWGQGGNDGSTVYAYNGYIKYMNGNQDILVGCGPVAMAQIIAYNNYINPNAYAKNSMPAAFNILSVGDFSGTYNFGMLRGSPIIKSTAPADKRGQVAALMYNVLYEVLRIAANRGRYEAPTVNLTNTYTDDCLSAFENFGYTIDYDSGSNATTVTGTNNGTWSISYKTPLSAITNA